MTCVPSGPRLPAKCSPWTKRSGDHAPQLDAVPEDSPSSSTHRSARQRALDAFKRLLLRESQVQQAWC